jgi:hypothetical protein
MGRTRSTHGRDEKYINIFYRNTRKKRSLGRPRRRLEDNIRMNLGEIGLEVVD